MTTAANSSLRQMARRALAQFGVVPRRLTELANRHNHVFRVAATNGQRWILRIQNDVLTDAQAQSQLQWLEDLWLHSEVRVPKPARTLDGRPFAWVECDSDRRRAVLLQWLPGRVAKTRRDNTCRAAARMIAQLHHHAETFRPPRGFSCRRLDGDWLFGERFFVRAAKADGYFDASARRAAASAERIVRGAMQKLGHRRRRFGVLHADLNLDNIVFDHGRPSPIDFDEFGKGWYLFDLAELIRTSIRPQNWVQRKELALSAYVAERALDEAELEVFDAFIVATFVQYLNWSFAHARDRKDLKWVGFCVEVMRGICANR